MKNWFIDFDGTLYNTEKLKEDLLNIIIEKVQNYNITKEEATNEVKSMFNRENIYNIYNLAIFFADKYGFDSKEIISKINDTIEDGQKYLYEDSIEFVKKIKNMGNTIHIFTYATNIDIGYQNAKIKGSKIASLFDVVLITAKKKHELNINYQKGIFVDDSPEVLKGLYSVKPERLIRIRRQGNKYSLASLEDIEIEEYEKLSQIIIE